MSDMVCSGGDGIGEEQQNVLMNAVCAAVATRSVRDDQGNETNYLQPNFLEATRSELHHAYLVSFEAMYSAGPAMGNMTLCCWVLDEEDPIFGDGVKKVVDVREDPTGDIFRSPAPPTSLGERGA
mmetsp:Transcript_70520/g.146854  ORF Transcript_70520/g.146854 Transcript_70520/m.146854 type:complete len:125 (+) Transcript_70520:144-518(+)